MVSGNPRNLRKEILSVTCLSSSGSERPCHSCKTSSFIITISSVFGRPPFLVLLAYMSPIIDRKADQLIKVSICDNLSPNCSTRAYSSRNVYSNNDVMIMVLLGWVLICFEIVFDASPKRDEVFQNPL